MGWLYLILRPVTAFGPQVSCDSPSQKKVSFVSSQCEYTSPGWKWRVMGWGRNRARSEQAGADASAKEWTVI